MDIGKFVRDRVRQAAAQVQSQAQSGEANQRDDVNIVVAVNTGEPGTVTHASARQDVRIEQHRKEQA